MTPHTHREFVPGCYRCDLGLDEVANAEEERMSHARDEAVEVMARAMCSDDSPGHGTNNCWQHAEYAALALDALTSPQSVVCETCQGGGRIPTGELGDTVTSAECPDCNGSGRVEKGPIAYLAGELEQVGWTVPCRTDSDDLYQWALRASRWNDGDPTWEPVYRLPTQSGSEQ